MNQRTLGIIALLLLLGLVGALVWGFGQSKEVKELQQQKAETTVELTQMTQLRNQLAEEVKALSAEYESVASDNESLEGQLTTAQQELRRVQRAFDKSVATNANDKKVAYEMRKQIEDLIMVRSDLERSIQVVSAQNDSLRSLTTVLRNQLGASQDENRQLTEIKDRMESEIKDLTLKNFRASAFQIDLLRRNGEKVTTKGSRVKKIVVSFDLTSVPEEYQGVRPLYLVISDQTGTPIGGTNTIPVKAIVNGTTTNLSPVLTKDFNIEESQRLNLIYEVGDKLQSGHYQAKVYTDIGLLGASSFQLR